MWLFTSIGFFSIVRKPSDAGAGTLTVRARVRSDLEALRSRFLPDLGPIVEGAGTDYRYRAVAPQHSVAAAMQALVAATDYDNFKSEVAHTQGHARAQAYSRVWGELQHLDDGGRD